MKSFNNYNTPSDFAMSYPFTKPIHRLIMVRIVMAGSHDGTEERIIDDSAFSDFCCCSKHAFYRERNALARQGYLKVRKIGSLDNNSKLQVESARGYTILSEGK